MIGTNVVGRTVAVLARSKQVRPGNPNSRVHHKGRAVVSSGTREEMERDVTAMHSYGLWATLQKDD